MRDGDEYVINGNKVFTSGANQADYIWLACRTDPEAPKHKGISIILVPTDVARVQVDADRHGRARTGRPRPTTTTCACRSTNLVGEENGGWRLITTQLNHERVGLAAHSGEAHELYDDVARLGRTSNGVLIDLPWVQLRPGPVPRPARGDEAAQLAHGHRGGRRRR